MVNIEVNEFIRLTVRWFVLEYLFKKGGGDRLRGEAYGGEMYRAWEQLCIKIGKKSGKRDSFYRALRNMKSDGILVINRTEKVEGIPIPRNYYVLDRAYFDELMKEKGL